MSRKLGHALLIVAVLAATGTHWLVLQSVAWTTMLADNLQASSFTEAVERTFDGKHPCCLCLEIRKGRQAEKKSDSGFDWKKLEFPYARVTLVFVAPSHFREARAPDDSATLLPQPPPVPPPRELLGC